MYRNSINNETNGSRDELKFYNFFTKIFSLGRKNMQIHKKMLGDKVTDQNIKKFSKNFIVQAIILGELCVVDERFTAIPLFLDAIKDV